MDNNEISNNIQQIMSFNARVRTSEKYNERRLELRTQPIFPENYYEQEYIFQAADENFCLLPEAIAEYIESGIKVQKIFKFKRKDHKILVSNTNFLKEAKDQIDGLLYSLVCIYFNEFRVFVQIFHNTRRADLEQRIAQMRDSYFADPQKLFEQNECIKFLKTTISKNSHDISHHRAGLGCNKYKKKAYKIREIHAKSDYSISELCKLYDISETTYYKYIKNNDKPAWEDLDTIENHNRAHPLKLSAAEMQFIKYLVNDPLKSYTCQEICELINKDRIPKLSYGTIYYHLRNSFHLRRKRNRYRIGPVFSQSQRLIEFNFCKKYIEMLQNSYVIIMVDESVIYTNNSREYSYAEFYKHPLRMRETQNEEMFLIMALCKYRIISYQISKSRFTEHSFLDFIIRVSLSILNSKVIDPNKVAFILDSATYHSSEMCMQLLDLLPFTFLFGPAGAPEAYYIDTIFGLIKMNLRKNSHLHSYYC